MSFLKTSSNHILVDNNFHDVFQSQLNDGKVLLLIDENVWKLYQKKIKLLEKIETISLHSLIIPAGEQEKEYHKTLKYYNYLNDNNFCKSDTIIAIGGGVVGDLGGFVAATYFRGINYIAIPTTLLSMIDSSYGGKVGVNLCGKKNIIGSFYNPKKIIIDPVFLKTLSMTELKSGIAEIIKYGLIFNKELYEILLNKNLTLENFLDDQIILEQIISESLMTKEYYVKNDYQDLGVRNILNYGHTFGHALESISNFSEFTHGQAVALGIKYINLFANHENILEKKLVYEVENILAKFQLNISFKYSCLELYNYMKNDKKNKRCVQRVIMLNDLQEPEIFEYNSVEFKTKLKEIDEIISNLS